MENLKVKIHSLIDVITNSSTEMYLVMGNDAIDGMYEIINEVLKIGGSDKRAEDLFTITINRDWCRVGERFLDSFYDYGETTKEADNDLEKAIIEKHKIAYYGKGHQERNWKAGEKVIMEDVVPYLKESGKWKEYSSFDECDTPGETWLEVIPKDQNVSTMDIWSRITSLFEITETSN
jgi:hypothetical protein